MSGSLGSLSGPAAAASAFALTEPYDVWTRQRCDRSSHTASSTSQPKRTWG